MRIAVLSDIHDNIWNLQATIKRITELDSQAIIFCGDFCSPFISPFLVQTSLPVYACFGNNDEDHSAIIERASSPNFHTWSLGREFAEIELGGSKIAFCHYPKLGRLLAGTGEYQAVFHGHTHIAFQEKIGSTLLANPGAVCGIVSGKPGPASFGIYNTSDQRYSHINL